MAGNKLRTSAPTLSQIARSVGVSPMTVSRALNDQPGVSQELRERIRAAAGEMGYATNWVAKKLSARRSDAASGIIGVIAEMHAPFIGEIVTAIGKTIRERNRDMLVYSMPDAGQDLPGPVIDMMLHAVDGIIAVMPRNTDYLERFRAAHIPVVAVDQREDPVSIPWVSPDNYRGATMAVQHLIDLGHQRIAFIGGDARHHSAHERLRAYRDTVRGARLPVDDSYIADGRYHFETGQEAAQRLLNLPQRPTAIFAANDASACGAMAAILGTGLSVPDDISIVGFDDSPISRQITPTLTTLRQPKDQLAEAAIKLLLEGGAEAGAAEPEYPIKVPVELIRRCSTATLKWGSA